MVKKKGKSKRTSFKDKYKTQKRTLETHRKRRKQAKRDAAGGIVRHDKTKKDPGIPNSWPFKQDLLKEIQHERERQQKNQQEVKEKRKDELRLLRQHQEQGGSARTVQELMEQANRDNALFEAKQGSSSKDEPQRSDGSNPAGQQSRRAYLRELKKVVDSADVLLQVLDARDPVGTRIHPSVEDAILSRTDKRMVLVLNKIDLVPKEIVASWLATLRRSHPAIAVKASHDRSSSDDAASATTVTSAVGMDGLLQLLKNYARTGGTGGKSKTTIVVGIVGYPNVGKSSIINALKRTRAVGVSPRPGFTTSMQEVVLDRNVRLLDSPGVVFDDRSALLGNCVDPESIEDPIPAVEALLKRCNHASLLMTYNIPDFPRADVFMFLSMVAKSYGRVLKGGVPDKCAAARAVLKDWNNGRIPFYTAPPKNSSPEVSNDAVIVSEFGKEFDVSRFDESVMKTLKEQDEMDFVKLENSQESIEMGAASRQAIDFFASNGSDAFGDDDLEMEGEEDDRESDSDSGSYLQNGSEKANQAMSDDYNFDEMC